MRAAQINGYGDHTRISVTEVEQPAFGDDQVLVETHASGINPFDGMVLAGYMHEQMPLAFPATLGGDFAGIAIGVGDQVTHVAPGDRVYGGQANAVFGHSGAHAEYLVVTGDKVAKAPFNLDFAQAAALPLGAVSALQALTDGLHLAAGEKILIHGGSGGVGAIAVQIAKHLGATVTATASSANLDVVRVLGADQVIDYSSAALSELDGEFDAIFDSSGSGVEGQLLHHVKPGGRVVSMTGEPDESITSARGVIGQMQFTVITTQKLDQVRELVEIGAVSPQINAYYDLSEISDAFRAKLTGEVAGKVVIRIR